MPALKTACACITIVVFTTLAACEKQPANGNQNQSPGSSTSDAPIMDPLQDIPLDDATPPPVTLTIDRDNIEVTESCTIPAGQYRIPDLDNNGVLHITADNVTVTFEPGAVLIGSTDDDNQLPDAYTGTGIRITDADCVTISGATIRGYKAGIHATNATGLTLDHITIPDNYRQHLRSTPVAEDGADWLSPHHNDNNEWLNNYGAAVYVEDSTGITIHNCTVRNSQNGLLLDSVSGARVYDNDCSFLSGWGLGLWRTSDSVITRNAFDFCVRGYSHGVYNRGQDSAGILMFEQNNNNLIAENSATHGGDCFFGFAGLEALGNRWMDKERARLRAETGQDDVDALLTIPDDIVQEHRRLGNNNNLLIANDFSYAPAHGIEMTFSFDNKFVNNRMVENAICGVWGGYSQDTLITGNRFEGNGEMPYGSERGGINIEHGVGNRIEHNRFVNNKCGVFLWWNPNENFLKTPWGIANPSPSDNNTIANNRFDGDTYGVQLRKTTNTTLGNNIFVNIPEKEVDADEESAVESLEMPATIFTPPPYTTLGESVPYGARPQLRGRHNILMTEWGPWDHESPFLQTIARDPTTHQFKLHKDAPIASAEPGPDSASDVQVSLGEFDTDTKTQMLTINAPSKPGIHPYDFLITTNNGTTYSIEGTFLIVDWTVTVFPWTVDPREDLDGWYAESEGNQAITATTQTISFKYAFGSPSNVGISDEITQAEFKPDRFGTIAHTTLPLTAGTWNISTMSDDGVRVTVDGERVIDNWTWHGPTPNTGQFTLDAQRTVDITIEHFEIDGYAILEFEIEPAQ
ncbi:MAG: hypothetical protein D8M59_14025 [Planctomycetes bacterium]|nr:hypothetical protein [Planctomycetota bacterium]